MASKLVKQRGKLQISDLRRKAKQAQSFKESLAICPGAKEKLVNVGAYDLHELDWDVYSEDYSIKAKTTSRLQFDELYDRFVAQHKFSEKKGYYSEPWEECLLAIETSLYYLDHFIEEKSSRKYDLTFYATLTNHDAFLKYVLDLRFK